MKCEAVAQK